MNLDDRKLAPHFVWLFALAAVGVALAVTKLVPSPLGPKAWVGIYAGVYGVTAAAGTFLTRTGLVRALGAFAIAAFGLGIFHYISIARHMASAGDVGSAFGTVFALLFLGAAMVGAVGGALFGLKLRKNLARPLLGRA